MGSRRLMDLTASTMDRTADRRRQLFAGQIKPARYSASIYVAVRHWLEASMHTQILDEARNHLAYLSWPIPELQATSEPTLLEFVEWHQTRCASCGRPGRDDVIDHDHMTGLVRGLLCRSCNVIEGKSQDRRWGVYRAVPPAALYGVVSEYEDPDPFFVWAKLKAIGAVSAFGKRTGLGDQLWMEARRMGAGPDPQDARERKVL